MSQHGYSRLARVNEVVREVVAEELELLSDPRLELVTVTGVEVTADLKHATVFYSTLETGLLPADETEDTQERRVATAKGLRSARRHLQAALGRQVRLKYVPRLAFEEDPAVHRGRRIEDIIRRLHQEEGPG